MAKKKTTRKRAAGGGFSERAKQAIGVVLTLLALLDRKSVV